MRSVRHSVKQPDINAKTMRKKDNKMTPNMRNTSIVPRDQRRCAKYGIQCTHMRTHMTFGPTTKYK